MDAHDEHDELDFDDDEDLPSHPTPPPLNEEPNKHSEDDENTKDKRRGGEPERRRGSKRSRSGKRPPRDAPRPINLLLCSYRDYLVALRRAGLIRGGSGEGGGPSRRPGKHEKIKTPQKATAMHGISCLLSALLTRIWAGVLLKRNDAPTHVTQPCDISTTHTLRTSLPFLCLLQPKRKNLLHP